MSKFNIKYCYFPVIQEFEKSLDALIEKHSLEVIIANIIYLTKAQTEDITQRIYAHHLQVLQHTEESRRLNGSHSRF